eukprot:6214804-Pleurochrysis_carterae.AAC.1
MGSHVVHLSAYGSVQVAGLAKRACFALVAKQKAVVAARRSDLSQCARALRSARRNRQNQRGRRAQSRICATRMSYARVTHWANGAAVWRRLRGGPAHRRARTRIARGLHHQRRGSRLHGAQRTPSPPPARTTRHAACGSKRYEAGQWRWCPQCTMPTTSKHALSSASFHTLEDVNARLRRRKAVQGLAGIRCVFVCYVPASSGVGRGRALELRTCSVRARRLWADADRPRVVGLHDTRAECADEAAAEAEAEAEAEAAAAAGVRGDDTSSEGSLEEPEFVDLERLMEELDESAISQAALP